jgi:hypothetical protein
MICPSISIANGIQMPPGSAALILSATAVFPVPGSPVRKRERRELMTHPRVCKRESGKTRSRNAARTLSIVAGCAGIACRRIMCA